jgi:hypothetical protein
MRLRRRTRRVLISLATLPLAAGLILPAVADQTNAGPIQGRFTRRTARPASSSQRQSRTNHGICYRCRVKLSIMPFMDGGVELSVH